MNPATFERSTQDTTNQALINRCVNKPCREFSQPFLADYTRMIRVLTERPEVPGNELIDAVCLRLQLQTALVCGGLRLSADGAAHPSPSGASNVLRDQNGEEVESEGRAYVRPRHSPGTRRAALPNCDIVLSTADLPLPRTTDRSAAVCFQSIVQDRGPFPGLPPRTHRPVSIDGPGGFNPRTRTHWPPANRGEHSWAPSPVSQVNGAASPTEMSRDDFLFAAESEQL